MKSRRNEPEACLVYRNSAHTRQRNPNCAPPTSLACILIRIWLHIQRLRLRIICLPEASRRLVTHWLPRAARVARSGWGRPRLGGRNLNGSSLFLPTVSEFDLSLPMILRPLPAGRRRMIERTDGENDVGSEISRTSPL